MGVENKESIEKERMDTELQLASSIVDVLLKEGVPMTRSQIAEKLGVEKGTKDEWNLMGAISNLESPICEIDKGSLTTESRETLFNQILGSNPELLERRLASLQETSARFNITFKPYEALPLPVIKMARGPRQDDLDQPKDQLYFYPSLLEDKLIEDNKLSPETKPVGLLSELRVDGGSIGKYDIFDIKSLLG
jgi:hypothetical protein